MHDVLSLGLRLPAARPLTTQLRMLASALWFHPTGLVVIPWGLLLQWRVPDPALYLPFLCFQILAVARHVSARRFEPGAVGARIRAPVLCVFYCWTMAMAGLGIAFVLDRGARKVYGATLCIGSVIGLPQLAYSIYVDRLASAEAMRRFGLFTPAPRFDQVTVPALSLLAVAATAWWIWKSKRFDLVYLWSLAAGGILLSRSRVVSGIFFHEYHYDWLWTPIRMALVLIVAVSIVSAKFRLRPVAAAIGWTVLVLYFAGGVYLAAICVTRTWSGVAEVGNTRATNRSAWPLRSNPCLPVRRSRATTDFASGRRRRGSVDPQRRSGPEEHGG